MGDVYAVTVPMTEKAFCAMHYAAGMTGDTRTETVCRALLLYTYVLDARPGQRINLRVEDNEGGELCYTIRCRTVRQVARSHRRRTLWRAILAYLQRPSRD